MTRTSKKRRVNVKAEATPERALISSLWGLVAAMICALCLILIFATAALFSKDPTPVSRIGGYLALYVSATVGGFFSYRKCGGYALLSGVFTGIEYFALTLILSMLVPLSVNMWLSILLRAVVVGASVGGAFLGAYRPTPVRRRRRK